MNKLILAALMATTVAPIMASAGDGNDIRFSNPRVAIIRESGHSEGHMEYRPIRDNSQSVDAFCEDQGYYRGGYSTSSYHENGAVAAYGGGGWRENNDEEAVRTLKCRDNR